MATSMWRLFSLNLPEKTSFFSTSQRLRIKSTSWTYAVSRCTSTISKNKLEVDPDVDKQLEDSTSFRKHPGVFTIKQVTVPVKLQNALGKIVDRYSGSVGNLPSLCENMINYLNSRRLPVEKRELQLRAIQYEKECLAAIKDLALKSADEMEKIEEKVKNKVIKKLKQTSYKWESIDYNPKNAMVYLASRALSDYATIFQIFNEIKKRDPEFKPRGFYDFGSGVGTGLWALNGVWPGKSVEYYCVDISDDMHILSRLVLQDGEENKEMSLKQVYYRQFAPASHKNKYEMVLSAYTLLELTDKSSRIKAVMDLWKKTSDYLVIVENGTKAGFKVVLEARDAILKASKMSKHLELSRQDKEYEVTYEGHVFAPCSHDIRCPWPMDSRTPCNYEASYGIPNWSKNWSKTKNSSTNATARYSYVVMKKGSREEKSVTWPRLIRHVSRPSKHVHCRLCCANGKLEHHILTERLHGKTLYKCSRASNWGDLIPAKLIEVCEDQSNVQVDGHELDDDTNSLTDSQLNFSEEHVEETELRDDQSESDVSDSNNESILVMGRSTDPQIDIRTRRGLTLSGTDMVRVILNKTDDVPHTNDSDGSDDTGPSPVPT